MHISTILFFLLIIGVAVFGFLAGYLLNSLFRDMERRDVEVLEKEIERLQNIIRQMARETIAQL